MAEAEDTATQGAALTLRSFMRHFAHELGNPVASIRMSAEMLVGDYPPEMHAELFQIIMSEALRLETLIESAVYYCSIAPPSQQEVELPSIIESAMRHGDVRIPLDVRADLANDTVSADVPELTRAIREIFLNASQSGASAVDVSARREDGDAVIVVADDGAGIPAADLPHIFERFYRADKARSRELGGTGLGLSIVKHIVQAHGGSISAASTQGQGTTITLRFPLESAAAEPLPTGAGLPVQTA